MNSSADFCGLKQTWVWKNAVSIVDERSGVLKGLRNRRCIHIYTSICDTASHDLGE